MRIKHRYTGKEIGGTYQYWKDNILKNHVEENYEILSKPDLVDVYKINPITGNKIFIETTDRRVAIETYLSSSDNYTIKETDLSQFDELYRKRDNSDFNKLLTETLSRIIGDGSAVVTKDTPFNEEKSITSLYSNGYLTKMGPHEYQVTDKGHSLYESNLKTGAEKKHNMTGNGHQFSQSNNKVFIVHGHNNEVKLAVARSIEKLGLEPIILHEQANNGKTIIEKFEQHSNVGFAIVLLTADDSGKARGEELDKQRARQNVILEMGYFIGKLGRDRVCPLYEKGVELPSDLYGLVYTELDIAESWKFKLAKELKEAGYAIDTNRLL